VKRNGFTLVELLVVISILGLLAMITIPRFGGFRERAVETATIAELQAVRQAWNYYEIEFGEDSLGSAEDLSLFLGEDLQGDEYMGKYNLNLQDDNDTSHIKAEVIINNSADGDQEKQRQDAIIFLDRIEIN